MKASLLACAVASAFACPVAGWAQQAPADPKNESKNEPKKIEQITVTASPLNRAQTELAQPATVLDSEELRRKRAASIGDTLARETGVQSSAFGAAAGRPIIRGLEGPRIRVLENGIGTMDASSVSPDHVVTTESLHADQIEILRGPASLLYGSGAIGGVVNVVSNLIPRKPVAGLEGDFEARAGSANRERTASANLNAGAGEWALHLDGSKRRTGDYRIPSAARQHANEFRDEPIAGDRLPDSFVDAKGGGVGGSWVRSGGYVGAGIETLENTYGIPTGEGSRIHMRQNRYTIAADQAQPFAGVARVQARLGHTNYRHEEIEASGDIATRFRNKATEGRLEIAHAPWLGGVTGTLGVQFQDQDLSALGEESLFPRTRSRGTGVFLVEQRTIGSVTLDAGIRGERATRRPTVETEQFAFAVDRDFTLVTPAFGAVWKFAPGYNASVSVTQAQRAPSTEELYSFGHHGATNTFEVGNATLGKEVSRNIDLTVRRTEGETTWKANVFANRIRDYIYTASVDADGDGEPDRLDGVLVQRYSQADATFRGVEAEWGYRPRDAGWGVRVFGDLVRARLAGGENLPRIAPARLGMQLDQRWGDFSAWVSAIHAFAQRRAAPLESSTPGYTRVDGEISWRLSSARAVTTIFLQGTNLLDQSIRLHTSYLKDVAPQMGRSVTLGLRTEF